MYKVSVWMGEDVLKVEEIVTKYCDSAESY